jgi:hypothetical protein
MTARGCPVGSRRRGPDRPDYSTFEVAFRAARPAGWMNPVGTGRLPQGCLKERPSIDTTSGGVAPASVRVVSHPTRRFGPTLPRVGRIPSPRFLTASTACATRKLAGLLQPAADPGVHRVLLHPRLRYRSRDRTSPPVLHPPELSPPSAASPASPQARSSSSFPTHRSVRRDLEALLHRGVRSPTLPLPAG